MSSIELETNKQASKRGKPIAIFAVISLAYFLLVDIVLYVLKPGYELFMASSGGRDVEPYGFLAASAFFSLGLGSLALLSGLYLGVSRSGRSLPGLLLLGIWELGMLVSGIFSC